MLCMVACAFAVLVSSQQTTTEKPAEMMDAAALADSLIAYAKTFIGTPYKYGSNGPHTFDCSGFTSYVYRRFGYKLNRTSGGQGTDGRAVGPNFKQLQKGDILLFSRSKNNHETIGHAGIFIALDDTAGTSFSFIHASSRGVTISHYTEGYYRQRYMFARRILPDFEDVQLLSDSARYLFGEYGYIHPDTLSLSAGDRRVVLFANGSWAYLDSLGILLRPDSTTKKMVLNTDGTWGTLEQVRVPAPAVQTAPVGQSTTTTTTTRPVATAQPAPTYYKVKQGDTLSKIASRYGTSVKALCRLNGIRETTVLKIGQKLRVK